MDWEPACTASSSGAGTATDRCFKHLVGFREGSLTVNIPLRHTRATQLLFHLAPSLDSSAEKNVLETSSGKRTFLS
ncbi:hypothetical protein PO909_022606 [Leuciscus waleckii]